MSAPDFDALLARYPHCRAEVQPANHFVNRPRLRLLTVEAVLAENPCYDDESVRAIAARKFSGPVTIVDAIRALRGDVPDADLFWLATRPVCYEAPDVVLRWLAADFAAAALPLYERDRPGDARPRRAIEAARLYALGLIDAAALDAALDAAWDAAWDAARAAQVYRILAVLGGDL